MRVRVRVRTDARAREDEMPEKPRKAKIQLCLTEGQKEQVREATGRDVDMLELRVEPLPEPAEGTAPEEERRER
jgi:hypothetical protein